MSRLLMFLFMKKLLLIILNMLFAFAITAQNRGTILEEHFDSTEMPAGWEVMGDGQENWIFETYQMYAGGEPYEVTLCYWPVFNGISRLVTPPVNLTGVPSVVFTMKHCLRNMYGIHTLTIETTSDNGATWNIGWGDDFSDTYLVGQIEQLIVTPDMGKPNVRFAITYTGNSGDLNRWHFDDVLIYSNSASNDMTLKSIDTDPKPIAGYNEITFTVVNRSTDIVNEFEASYEIDDVEVRETFNATLSSNQEEQFTFVTPVLMTPGNKPIIVTIETVGGQPDANPEDNTLVKYADICLGTVQRIPMIEHFSSSTCSPCVGVNEHMEELCASNEGHFTYTKYPMYWPGQGDPYYTEEGGVRRSYYDLNSVPMCYLDAERFNEYVIYQDDFDEHYNTPAYADMRGSFTVDANSIYAKVDFMSFCNKPIFSAFVAVNEKETHGNVGTNGETEFHHVFMKFLTDANGDVLEIPAGEYRHFEYSYNLGTTNVEDMSDLEVAAWLQNYVTQEVWNSHFLYEYSEIHPYPVRNLTFVNDAGTFRATWEVPEGGNALSYNIYVNGVFVKNTTDLNYSFSNGDEYACIAIQAVYVNNMTSVMIAKMSEILDQIIENEGINVNIYPNPTNGNFTVKGENISSVEIYNICGQMIKSLNVNGEMANIDMSSETPGIYMMKVYGRNGISVTKKIVKK